MRKSIKTIVTIAVIILLVITIIGFIKKGQREKRKYEIETIGEYKYFVVKENEKYGVIDTQGNKLIDTKYDNVKIPNPTKDIFICYEKNNSSVINSKNEIIFKQYNNVEPLTLKNISSDLIYEKNTLKYEENGKYGIVDFNGKKITKAIYEDIDTLEYKEGELLVKKDGKYGVINIKGTTLVKTNYDVVQSDKYYEDREGYKNSGYIVTETTDEGYRYGYVNIKGKEIVDTKYNELYRITEINSDDIYMICAENGKYGLLKNSKKIIDNEYQSLVYNENDNRLIALKGKRYGVLSIDGKEIVPAQYSQIDVIGQYIYATDSNENTKVFNSNGQEMNMSKNIAILDIADTDYKIYMDTEDGNTKYSIYKGQEKITNEEYRYIQYLFDNLFIASDTEGNLGVIDNNERTRLQFNYGSIQKIENTNMIQATNNNEVTEIYSKEMEKICDLENATVENYGEYIKIYNEEETKYITKEGKEVQNTELFKNNKIFANKFNGKWGFVDLNGNKVVNYEYEKVTEQNKYGFAGIKQDGKWGIVNSEGNIIVQPEYELGNSEPTFIGEYYKVIYGNGEMYYTK